jgi:hypothetical protein
VVAVKIPSSKKIHAGKKTLKKEEDEKKKKRNQ